MCKHRLYENQVCSCCYHQLVSISLTLSFPSLLIHIIETLAGDVKSSSILSTHLYLVLSILTQHELFYSISEQIESNKRVDLDLNFKKISQYPLPGLIVCPDVPDSSINAVYGVLAKSYADAANFNKDGYLLGISSYPQIAVLGM